MTWPALWPGFKKICNVQYGHCSVLHGNYPSFLFHFRLDFNPVWPDLTGTLGNLSLLFAVALAILLLDEIPNQNQCFSIFAI